MIDKIWNKMCKVGIDKLWHFIAFREFTALLLRTSLTIPIILIIVIGLAIGKEFWDWWHGDYVDFGDLLADALGITMAFIN